MACYSWLLQLVRNKCVHLFKIWHAVASCWQPEISQSGENTGHKTKNQGFQTPRDLVYQLITENYVTCKLFNRVSKCFPLSFPVLKFAKMALLLYQEYSSNNLYNQSFVKDLPLLVFLTIHEVICQDDLDQNLNNK